LLPLFGNGAETTSDENLCAAPIPEIDHRIGGIKCFIKIIRAPTRRRILLVVESKAKPDMIPATVSLQPPRYETPRPVYLQTRPYCPKPEGESGVSPSFYVFIYHRLKSFGAELFRILLDSGICVATV
jgi:hypothetical protein